ncbi:ABC transporter substrate-binding protein [Devosia sp. 1566]|uniref:ABC transporter substrate-binding protein n=1 Tax=Devosia sp. 1566 TaxID=2499144 RepID=UPI000FDB0191|nr:ABC transporter substrate-binding protein [Devosia sp. 1566]
MKRIVTGLLLASTFLGSSGLAFAQQTTLTIESWRNDDLPIWNEKIIPAFESAHPEINVEFAPLGPTEYNSAVGAKLEAGTAGDLITCRPFDLALAQFTQGYLAALNDLPGIENFSDVAKSAWTTDDGATTFCVPMASVIHGFIYNKDIFAELGLEVPATEDEFFAVLDAIKEDGTYTPLAMGTKDQWEAATMGYYNIAPNAYKGEEGRLALISGEQKLTDPQWVEPYTTLARWSAYLGDGFEAQTYPDSQNLFTLGRAAIFPAGSWEISVFEPQVDFEMGAFKPPVKAAGDKCYISDHNDIGLGLNAASPNAEAARTFLSWVASTEFAEIYANASPGFFSLNSAAVPLENELAQEFVSWREDCETTIRHPAAILGRGEPNLDIETWRESANVINGTTTPEDAAKITQDGLASWYEPQQSN